MIGGPSDGLLDNNSLVKGPVGSPSAGRFGRSGAPEETELGGGKIKYVIWYNYINPAGDNFARGAYVTTVIDTTANNKIISGPTLSIIKQ